MAQAEQRVREILRQLSTALRESAAGSERVADALAAIRAEGYELSFVLQATPERLARDDEAEPEPAQMAAASVPAEGGALPEGWNEQDLELFRELRLRVV